MFGAETVRRYFDEDGDGAADAAIVTEFCAIATATAHDLLLPFRVATIVAVKVHERYKRIVSVIAIGDRTMSKPAWMLPTGRWPYEIQKNEAKVELVKIAEGMDRMGPAGPNPMMQSTRRPSQRDLIFAPSEKNPTGGGRF